MLARLVTLRFDSTLEAFDDGPLQEFQIAKEVHAIHGHFFVRDGARTWLCLSPTDCGRSRHQRSRPGRRSGGTPRGAIRSPKRTCRSSTPSATGAPNAPSAMAFRLI